jgi:hypothetical protein
MSIDTEALEARKVRLFPSHHISSVREAELRAAASLLAMIKAVSEFGRAVVSLTGGPKGKAECYTEVTFRADDTGAVADRPDGLIQVTRGQTDWRALVEVKVGDAALEQDQFDRYHRLAGDEGINGLLTISNQAALPNGLPPDIRVDGRRLRRVPVVHVSWQRLLSEAHMLSRKKDVADPDQQWMLEEWIQYVADPESRIIEPPQLGKHWNAVLSAARQGNLAGSAPQLRDVVVHWDAFLRKLGLRLKAKLGVEVEPRISRAARTDPEVRIRQLHARATDQGELSGEFRIPGAAGDLALTVLLASRTVRCGLTLDAPSEGRAKTRVNWLLRQLRDDETPRDLVLQVHWDARGMTTQAKLREALDDPSVLMRDATAAPIPGERMPRSFLLEQTVALAKGRGRSTAPVLEGIARGVEGFYRNVVEGLQRYVPRAPRLAQTEERPIPEQVKKLTEPPAGDEVSQAPAPREEPEFDPLNPTFGGEPRPGPELGV